MHIAMIAPPWAEIPPNAYGGIESMCFYLVEGLTARGHEVTLIGAGRDQTRARFVQTYEEPPEGLGEASGGYHEVLHAARAESALRALSVDVVHDHTFAGPAAAAGRDAPTVMTVHGPAQGELLDFYHELDGQVSMVAISDAQRALAPELPWVGTVHNALRLSEYPFQAEKEDFLLFLGRLSPEKGAHLAIGAARAAGCPIVLAGRCTGDEAERYFEDVIRPLIGPGVEWTGEADVHEKKDLYARARCLLFPIEWEEPFGMVMIEAMACGTPVVALRRGSVPEIVVDGETGFVVDRADDLPGAIERVAEIDPERCRELVAERFDVPRMAEGYEAVYEHVRAAWSPPGPRR